MSDTSPRTPGIFAAILAAFRQNRVPGLLLNALVIALVASYYHWPALSGIWEAVAAFKMRWSFAFSFVSTSFAAAIMPFLVQAAMGTLPPDGRLKRLVILVFFWGYRGMEIDLFYRLQGLIVGQGHDAVTLITKVAIDQLVYSPFWAVPTYLVVLRWVDLGASWSRTRDSLDREFWTRTFPTVLVTNWLIWIPAVALVYSLPPLLQFPLFSVVMCFFVLIVTLLARGAAPQPGIRDSIHSARESRK